MVIPPDPTPNVAVQVAFTSDPLDAAPTWMTVGTAEQAQVKRGGAYQQNAVQAGTATVEIDNAVPDGAAGALYTPGNAAGLRPTPDRPVQILVTPPAPYAGVTYPIHTGNADAWETRLDAAGLDYSRATLKSVDGMVTLAGITLRSTLAQEILADRPVGYFPLGEQAGATSVGNLAPPGGVAHLDYAGAPGGAAAFGGAVLAPSDPATALAFGPHRNSTLISDGGVLLNPTWASSRLTVTSGFTLSCVFSGAPHAGEIPTLFSATYDGTARLPFYNVYCDASGRLFFLVFQNDAGPAGTGVITSALPADNRPNGYLDGKPHFMHAILSNDGLTVSLYVDGVLGQSVQASTVFPAGLATDTIIGGLRNANGPISAASFFDGQLSHVAYYQHPLTAARVAAQYQAFLGFPGELSGTHINRILGYAGDTAAARIDPGRSALGPMLIGGQSALAAVQDAAAAEEGLFFKDGSGRSVFQDRGHRQNAVSKVTLNIGDDSLPVEPDITFSIDRTFIRNDITGSRPNGAVQRVQDSTSQRQHRRVTEPSPLTVNLPTDDQVLYALQWRLLHLAQPMVRIPQCSIKPVTSPALWPWALGLEVGDQITIANLPPTAPAPTMQVVIDAIDYGRVTADEWIVTFLLSPAEPFQYLRADGAPSAHTKLDSGLKIGW